MHNFPFIHNVSWANTSEPSKSEKQTLVANSIDLLDVLRGLAILDLVLCSEGTQVNTILVLHNRVKGVACETRSEPW